MSEQNKSIICLLGPTASGKTPLAVQLVQQFPCEIVSVDSAMIYREMDIGTAKPDADTLRIANHRLINICDPAETYSAGKFREDALREIDDIIAAGKIPLLVGGTMLYFRVLLQGIATLPRADEKLRAEILERAQQDGWEALHAYLATIDPQAAARIHANDTQRIQRAIEVFELTGKNISDLQRLETSPLSGYNVTQLALMPASREKLHERIALRFQQMLDEGLIDEVEKLYKRGDLQADLPSIRSVGYRQVWDYLAGNINEKVMQESAIAATRQLAKRQITWLRTWENCHYIDSEVKDLLGIASKLLHPIFK